MNPENACRCEARAAYAVSIGRVKPGEPLFGEVRQSAPDHQRVKEEIRRLDELRSAVVLYRSHPEFRAPEDVRDAVTRLLSARGAS